MTYEELLNALYRDSPVNTNWILLPYPCGKDEILAVWIIPEKLKLLRELGMVYALNRHSYDNSLLKIKINGIKTEAMPAIDFPESMYAIPTFEKPIVSKPIEDCMIRVGLHDFEIIADGRHVRTSLQHLIDDAFNYQTFHFAQQQKNNRMKKMLGKFFHKKQITTSCFTTDEYGYCVNYRAIIQSSESLAWAQNANASEIISGFFKKGLRAFPAPVDYYQYVFVIRMEFGQVETDRILAFVSFSIEGNGGRIELFHAMNEAKSQNEFILFLEDRLKYHLQGNHPKI